MESVKELDKILIKNLTVRNVTGVDSWQRAKSQPVVISVWLYTDITAAGDTDHVTNSIHYGHVTKGITKLAETNTYQSLEALAHAVVKLCCVHFGAERTMVKVEQPKALLHAAASGIQLSRTRQDFSDEAVTDTLGDVSKLGYEDMLFVKDLKLHTIIGVNPWEREEKQIVIVNLTIYPSTLLYPASPAVASSSQSYHLRTLVRTLTRYIEASGFKTLEAFAVAVARVALEKCHINKIRVCLEKPSAILFADASGMEVTRDRQWLQQVLEEERKAGHAHIHGVLTQQTQGKDIPPDYAHTAYLALGSNLGDRVAHLHQALDLLESQAQCVVVDTSFLYETPPMYYTEQPAFLNAVCKVATSLDPPALLAQLKAIEEQMGREASFRNAPRPIDLDILFYNNLVLNTPDLIIPHASLQEREFVLYPLCDVAKDVEHPRLYKTCGQLLSQLLKVKAESEEGLVQINKVIPIQHQQRSLWPWHKQTYIMGILNTTPDSFSDGGDYIDVGKAVQAALSMQEQGADIIDIGGMSTRPGADDTFPEDEEIRRVVPVITQLRQQGFALPISIDTFRASVAEAALAAGADMINDISGGTRDPRMLQVMAKSKAPVCLMHMRGDAHTMMNKTNTTYEDDVVQVICQDIYGLVQRALAAGVYRWNMVLDPGVGFAKTVDQDLKILRHLGDMVADDALLEGFPMLVGPSRKKFIGKITGVDQPNQRSYGTAAAVAASIAGKANILRVHDVRPMVETARMCDAVWKNTD
ncbi:Dihydropteroate synthase [Hesseltinella vesiculosa]|uniref:Folic acid synthesis protein FOL1 n=1 Tax=Hesseltinella vesiculosa TaxID=101127 RepID=A0A1X2GNZ6_9FUNG|nr:Dihydropteroate synthase [Hesseltinella vesiculosa]